MNESLAKLVCSGAGVVTRRAALREVPEHVWSYAVRNGQLATAFPGVAVEPGLVDDPATRRRAALECAGPGAALSHTSALAVWGLPVNEDGPVHVTTGLRRRIRVPGIAAHRRSGFTAEPPQVVIRNGLPVTRLEQSLVDAWSLAAADAQRAPLLHAIGQRMTTPERVAEALRRAPTLPGKEALRALLRKLAAGCRSELELWGYDHIFTGPGMPAFQWQVTVRLGSRTVYLDAYHPVTRPTSSSTAPDGTPHPDNANATSGATPPWPPWASWWSGSPTTGSCASPSRSAARSSPSSPLAD